MCPVIMKRIEQYSQNEIRFNLLALIKNKMDVYKQKLSDLEAKKAALGGDMDVDGESAPGAAALDAELARVREAMAAEEDLRKMWRDENIRRKHNYIPFLFNFLKILAEKKQLKSLIEKAQQLQHTS